MKPGLCFYVGHVTEFRYDTVQGENLHPACRRRKHIRGGRRAPSVGPQTGTSIVAIKARRCLGFQIFSAGRIKCPR